MSYMSLKRVFCLGTRKHMTILTYTDSLIERTRQIMDNDCIIWMLSKTQFILTPNLVRCILEHFNFSSIEARSAINISQFDTTYEIRFPNSLIEDQVFKFVYLHTDFLRKNKDNKALFKLILPFIYGRNIPESLMCPVISDYCKADVDVTMSIFNYQYNEEMIKMFEIHEVIFNEPATIIIWKDGTKTVVMCQEGDVFDKEKGIALCFMKKLLGNKSNYFEIVKKWTSKPTEKKKEKVVTTSNCKKTKDRSKSIKFIRKHYREFGGEMTVRQLASHLGLGNGTVHRLICTIREEKN